MSEKVNNADDLDELSLLLDEMNAGRKPECGDRELAELLTVAEMIKNTSGPICPPKHILDQTVERALAGLEDGKPKPSRSWLFSGVLSTAAAVILVIGLNMLPSWKERVPIAPPTPAVSQQKEDPQAKATADEDPAAPQAAQVDTAPATKHPSAVLEQQKADTTVAQVLPAETAKPPAMAREAAIMMEKVPRTSQAKSAYIPETGKSPAPNMAPLKLPGKIPDLVVTDRENGVLRQVFFKGTSQEVTITQRLQTPEEVSTQARSNLSVSKANNGNRGTVHSVQVMIGGQEVTIEGCQSRQELLKLAESLTQ